MPSLHHVAVVGNSPEYQLGASGACGISKICNELGVNGVYPSFSCDTSLCFFLLDLPFQFFDVLLLLLPVELILFYNLPLGIEV